MPRNSDPYTAWINIAANASQASASLLKATELAAAAASVIHRRSWLGLQGAADPVNADYAELARLAPEKLDAFARSGAAVVAQFWEMQREMASLWVRQVDAGWKLALALWQLPLPHHAGQLHADYVAGTVDRATSSAHSIAGRASRLHDHAIAPIHRTAARNARRLARAAQND